MTQISLFDYLPKTIDDIKLGLLEDKSIIGPEIEVSDLCEFVGSKVIKSCGNDSFEVICIIDFQKDSDLVYKRFRPLPHNDIGYGEYVNSYIHDIVGIKECMACYEPFRLYDRFTYIRKEGQKDSFICSDAWVNGVFANGPKIRFFRVAV